MKNEFLTIKVLNHTITTVYCHSFFFIMDVLSNAIKTFTKGVFDEASKRIAEKFDISIEEANTIWADIYIDLDSIQPPKKAKSIAVKSSNDVEKADGCVHILSRGPRKGGECSNKISGKSHTGQYCNVHINQENKVKAESPVKKEVKSDIKIARDPKYGRYVHVATGLVFKSPKEKIVVGRQDEDGDLHKLKDKDIENCKKHRFIYDEDCVEKDEESEKEASDKGTEDEKSDEESDNEGTDGEESDNE